MPSAATIVESEVRELVRRRGLDPAVQSTAVRALVAEVVADYADRAVTSSLPPLVDATSVGRSVFDAVAGFGPLQPLLDDPSIEEVWINGRPHDGCAPRTADEMPPRRRLARYRYEARTLRSCVRPWTTAPLPSST